FSSEAHQIAQGWIERRLEVGRGRALADDQRAGDLKLACRELARACAWHDDGVCWNASAISDGLGTGDVDDRRAAGEHHIGAQYGALFDQRALGNDAARADEGAVLDNHGSSAGRFEHAADAHATCQVYVAADLRTTANGGPGINHRPGSDTSPNVD